MKYDYLVVGAGFCGAVIAERIASQLGQRVLLIDRRDHTGGNAYDDYDPSGVLTHRYGPHIFHTNSVKVVNYLSAFTEWQPYEHRVRGFVDGQFVPLPVNFTSIELMFGAQEGTRLNKLLADEFSTGVKVPILKMRHSPLQEVRKIAGLIYEKVFLHYNMKQWGMPPEELDPEVSGRVPIHLSYDDRYFQDNFQHMPREGYTPLFRQMLSHPLIEIRTGVSFQDVTATEKFNRVVFTGPIDEFFGYAHGRLPYRSIRFDWRTTQSETPIQCSTVENYPTPESQHPFTRSTEFRLLTGQNGIGWTTQAFEYPEAYAPGINEPFYPIPREENRAIFRKYEQEALRLKHVVFAGRLADYNYYNMDQAVARALSCFEKHMAAPYTSISV